MALTPADRGFEVQKLVDRIADLERQVATMQRAHLMSGQKAVVRSFSGGAMVSVEFLATGNAAPVAYSLGWSPAVGQGCVVHDYGAGYFVAFPVSMF